jgi:hypothetical protein
MSSSRVPTYLTHSVFHPLFTTSITFPVPITRPSVRLANSWEPNLLTRHYSTCESERLNSLSTKGETNLEDEKGFDSDSESSDSSFYMSPPGSSVDLTERRELEEIGPLFGDEDLVSEPLTSRLPFSIQDDVAADDSIFLWRRILPRISPPPEISPLSTLIPPNALCPLVWEPSALSQFQSYNGFGSSIPLPNRMSDRVRREHFIDVSNDGLTVTYIGTLSK